MKGWRKGRRSYFENDLLMKNQGMWVFELFAGTGWLRRFGHLDIFGASLKCPWRMRDGEGESTNHFLLG